MKMQPVTTALQVAHRRAALHPAGRAACRDRPGAVGDQAQHGEGQAQHQDLLRDRRAVPVHELGQEREEEQRRLRVGDIDQDALAEDPVEPRLARRRRSHTRRAIGQRAHAQVDQVGGADQAYGAERERRGHQDRRQPERGGGDVHQRAAVHAQRGHQPRAAPVLDALRHDVEHRRPRDQEQHQRGGDEGQPGGEIGHGASLSARECPVCSGIPDYSVRCPSYAVI